MDILNGLFSHAVLQRNSKGLSDTRFEATTNAVGALHATDTKAGKTLRGFSDKKIGRATAGKVKGHLKGVPTGGPYRIELTVKTTKGDVAEKARVTDVLVGDVWVLAGQSNMQGVGLTKFAPKPDKHVRAFYMDDSWRKAEEPLHFLNTAVDPVHNGGERTPEPTDPVTGVGPGLAFGVDMFKATGVPQGLIACAHGGTSMSQWSPATPNDNGQSLYGATVRRVRKNGGKIAGIVWYQGESDANDEAARHYTNRMVELVEAMRRDLGNKTAPIAVVQIARVINNARMWSGWNSVQEQQRKLPSFIKKLTVVPAIDLTLDDQIHIGGEDQNRLGVRLAQAMRTLIAPRSDKKAMLPPIELKGISVEKDPDRPGHTAHVVVEFANVVGSLTSHGSRPMGFTLHEGEEQAPLYMTRLEGNKARLYTMRVGGAAESLEVMYGCGVDPSCNIVDEADRSLPVLGPIATTGPRAITRFADSLRVMGPVQVKGGSEKLPALPKKSMLKARKFESGFCDVHMDYDGVQADDPVTYYACKFHCSEPMDLSVMLGYDGPVKVWVDGKAKLTDPSGLNPCVPDKAAIRLKRVTRGVHEVIVALGSNDKKAWGIMLRFRRHDVTKAQLERGPEAYVLPEIKG